MVFLAVVMGFLAESFRNRLADEQKAKLLKKAIVLDLKKDTIQTELKSRLDIDYDKIANILFSTNN